MIKSIRLLSTVLILAALSLPASEVILKRKAKSLSEQNANRSLDPATPSPARTTAPAARPSQPGANPANTEQAQNVKRLVADLAIIKSRSQVTPEQTQKLAKDLQMCAQAATKPSRESLNKLANNLGAALVQKKLSSQEQAQLAGDLTSILNSANLSKPQTLTVIGSVQAILKSIGVSQTDVQAVVRDLQAIAAEVQASATGKAR